MTTQTIRAKTYRKDYRVSNYLIKTTDLVFEILEDKTIVKNTMSFYKNPQSIDNSAKLFLNGERLKLISIKNNNKPVEYKIVDNGLIINNLDDKFTLEIITHIYPDKNTSLNGLYKSNGNFCSQCEAHGFRLISYYLDRPDILSIWSVEIIANSKKYPMLLSNGNLISQNTKSTKWFDPHPKPCYLFALVAGDFAILEEEFITQSNSVVALKIYVEKHNINKTKFAMSALKKAFLWEQKRFNLEYDLNTYMLVAVDDFNMGAMENKGLNIFNSKYVLADINTATDKNFIDIEAVIGHEYFHNWTGNRVTCQDWFQLSLKEGLTVFRDQEFTSDEYCRALKRIDDVVLLRDYQFSEDSGTMAHPVRPESYLEMNNFYTHTVYEKGAELVRMLHTILGEELFQVAIALYIKRYDGMATTIDNFVATIAEVAGFDLTQFKLWYSQAGTPVIEVDSHYDMVNKIFTIDIKQLLAGNNKAFYIPFNYALFDNNGVKIKQFNTVITQKEQQLICKNVENKPICSYLRNFCAPIIVNNNMSYQEKILLLTYEDDAFSRFDNAQELWCGLLLAKFDKSAGEQILIAFKNLLKTTSDNGLLARLITIPNEKYIQQQVKIIDVLKIHTSVKKLQLQFANLAYDLLLKTYIQFNNNNEFNKQAIADRELKNICLFYLSLNNNYNFAYKQYLDARCMTDKLAAFNILVNRDNKYRDEVLADFYNIYQNDTGVIDKWFSVYALAEDTNAKVVKTLIAHNKFSLNNPNRIRALIGSWIDNHHQFHTAEGYLLVVAIITQLNTINPQIGARFVAAFNHYNKYTKLQLDLQKQALKQILAIDNLSNDILEIAQKALKI